MKTLLVRKATKKDINSLISLQKSMARYHHALDPIWSKGEMGDAAWRKMLLGLLRRNNFSFLAFECNGAVVGYATAEIIATSPAYAIKKLGHIGNIFVAKAYRKFGLAKIAMKYFDEWFCSHGVEVVELRVDAANHVGVHAWRSLGFQDWRYILRRHLRK